MSTRIPACLPFVKFCIFMLAGWTRAKHLSLAQWQQTMCFEFSLHAKVSDLSSFTFLIHLPVSLLPCSSQISHWLFSAGSSAYVRNFFCVWCELRLMSSVTWKLPLKNWRNWQCSALFFRAIKGFIMHSVHGSPLKCSFQQQGQAGCQKLFSPCLCFNQ